jgi:DNA-binding protein YbaB
VNPEDVDFLQDLVLAACNEAIQKSQELAAQHMGKLTGGIKIPGLM